jgi:hypothetical protein
MNREAATGEHRTKERMAASAQSAERASWLSDVNSMLVSAFCHLVALIALGLLTVVTTDQWGGIKLFVNLEDGGPPAPILDGTSLKDAVTLDVVEEAAAAVGQTTELEISAPMTTALAELNPFGGKSSELSGASGKALGGGKQGDGVAGQVATEFFGIGGYGQTFVYVVDASDSMNDRRKFERAKYELLQTIEQLKSDQRFFVVFYNEGAFPMDADEPQLATEDNIAKVTQWIQGVEPTGGTNPLPALLFALSLRPDAIYFLSDGQFDPAVPQILRTQNRQNLRLKKRQIPIHTIAFFDRIAEGMMRTIARNSGGEYRYAN